jgi:hypothetical protein
LFSCHEDPPFSGLIMKCGRTLRPSALIELFFILS